jgi:diguanylate cyclase (GGDEF)-like protein/PAS domain S-box-containing protein
MNVKKEFYTELLENLYDGVYFVDAVRKITFWNKGAEAMSGFKSNAIVGKFCWDNVLTHLRIQAEETCDKHCPITNTIADGKSRTAEAFLRHKDGHLLPVMMRIAPIRDLKKAVVGSAVILMDNSAKAAIAQRYEECQKLALLDPLTKLANRRYMNMVLTNKLMETVRYGWPFGLLFIDIDHFKKVNDAYGHAVGDRVLKMVGGTLMNNLRAFDIVGRWGGEEFIAVVVNIDKENLRMIADRLRLLVERSNISVGKDKVSVTISIGASSVKKDDTIDALLKRVDKLMYKSKTEGRNRVSMQ